MRPLAAFTSSIRQLLPPPLYLALSALFVIFLDFLWFVFPFIGIRDVDFALAARDATLLVLMMGYGIYRVAAFHPLFRKQYFAWLERTPWQPGLPLPLGPVRLHWPDIVIVGCLALLLEDPRGMVGNQFTRPTSLFGITTFLQAHAMTLMFAGWLTRPRAMAYLAAFLLGVSALTGATSPLISIVTLILGSVVQHVGLNRSWDLFPWTETTDWMTRLKTGFKSAHMARAGQPLGDAAAPDRVHPSELGWPFGVCSPHVPPQVISRSEKLLISALVGFWLHVILTGVTENIVTAGSGLLGLYGVMGIGLTTLAIYGGNHASPINLRGRFLTLRWIIPRYDAYLLAPFAVVFVSVSGAAVGYFALELPLTIVTPTVLTMTLWTTILAGPSVSNWKLTAPARLTHGRLNRNTFDELS